MLTIGFLSQKGGVGKSTLAIHIASQAWREGLRVRLLDLDPQASAAKWAERRSRGGLDGPGVSITAAAALEATTREARQDGCDLLVLDTAPHADQAGVRAARVCDLVVMPLRPATFDLEAAEATIDIAHLAHRPLLAVLNAVPVRSLAVEREARGILDGLGAPAATCLVHHRVAMQHCMIDGRTAREYEPEGPAGAEIVNLWGELRRHAAVTA